MDECGHVALDYPCQLGQREDRGVLLPALKLPHIGSVHFGFECELLLRQPFSLPGHSNPLTDSLK